MSSAESSTAERLASTRIPIRWLLAFGAIYALAWQLGQHLYGSLDVPSPFWFPDSVLLCALLLADRRHWWLFVALIWPIRFAIAGMNHNPAWFLLATTINDSLKGLLTAWLLERTVGRPVRLRTFREIAYFIGIAAILVPIASALAAAPLRVALGGSFWPAAYGWFLGDALAQMVVTPALLYWCTADRQQMAERWLELLLLLAALGTALYFAFIVPHAIISPALVYVPVPFLIYAAVRLRARGAATALLMVALVSMVGVANGSGIFPGRTPAENVLSMQLFLIVLSCSLLSLATLYADLQRKAAELFESQALLRSVVDTAPAFIWMADAHRMTTYVSKSWLDFTGRPMAAELGDGWTTVVHPDDVAHVTEVFSQAFDARANFELQFQVRRHDGEYRSIVARGVPRVTTDGACCGYVGSAIDVTDLQRAEVELHELSGRLIDAQEQERARLARELHDDFGQRMALLQIAVERLAADTREISPRVQEHVRSAVDSVAHMSSQLHTLSHRLHPQTLSLVGLVQALESLCLELAAQHRLDIAFIHRDVPKRISPDVSLCLFRVAQEALHNVMKHSGAREAAVVIDGRDRAIRLTISDDGVGFDTRDPRCRTGLGLVSIRERLRLVGGRVKLESEPGKGTQIEAVVRIKRTTERAVTEAPSHEHAKAAGRVLRNKKVS